MVGTFRLARVLGFEISIHWSWLFILSLVTWTFATGILDNAYPDWADTRRWLVGAAIALIFFFSILAHELSHSILARHYGITVAGITLFVFGGVSNLAREPESARQEFSIAIVGPVTSFFVAFLFAGLYLLLDPVDDGAGAVFFSLTAINFAIGVFNLIPGYPLDGGRVLRSVFWAQKRDMLGATRTASNVGIFVAYGILAVGVASFFFVSVIAGVWLILIGGFLRSASSASYETLFMEQVLRGVPASAVASRDYTTIAPEITLQELAEQYVLEGHGRCFPVIVEDQLLGLVTLTDLKSVPRDDWNETTVFRTMTPFQDLRTVSMRDDLPRVLSLMAMGDINQVPLIDGKQLLGLIHRSEVIRYIQVRQEIGGATAA